MAHVLEDGMLERFGEGLERDERAPATVGKYLRDARAFVEFAGGAGAEVDRATVARYKAHLQGRYRPSSANSMLAAVNRFLRSAGWGECAVRPLRVQRAPLRPAERELTRGEYRRLVAEAERRGDERLSLVMQTLCATGMRVGELRFVTVEALRAGRVDARRKGRSREVVVPSSLRERLLGYAGVRGISHGPVFVTRGGRPLDRSNVLHAMKALCAGAGVAPSKVFPHNLRHLFARTFYRARGDLAGLADVLGHASVDTTRVYTRAGAAERERAIEGLGLVLGGAADRITPVMRCLPPAPARPGDETDAEGL